MIVVGNRAIPVETNKVRLSLKKNSLQVNILPDRQLAGTERWLHHQVRGRGHCPADSAFLTFGQEAAGGWWSSGLEDLLHAGSWHGLDSLPFTLRKLGLPEVSSMPGSWHLSFISV